MSLPVISGIRSRRELFTSSFQPSLPAPRYSTGWIQMCFIIDKDCIENCVEECIENCVENCNEDCNEDCDEDSDEDCFNDVLTGWAEEEPLFSSQWQIWGQGHHGWEQFYWNPSKTCSLIVVDLNVMPFCRSRIPPLLSGTSWARALMWSTGNW